MADTWSERISTSTELETEGSFQGRVEMSKASELSIALRASIVGYLVMSLTLNIVFFDILYFLIAVTAIADQFYRQKKPTVQQKIKQEAFSAA